MTRAEEIARKSAGIVVRAYLCCAEHSEYAHLVQEVSRLLLVDLESYAAEKVAAERERCAKILDGMHSIVQEGKTGYEHAKGWTYACIEGAARIREAGDPKSPAST